MTEVVPFPNPISAEGLKTGLFFHSFTAPLTPRPFKSLVSGGGGMGWFGSGSRIPPGFDSLFGELKDCSAIL